MSGEAVDLRRKRLRLRSWRRGTREMDLILGPFADHWMSTLDLNSLDEFEMLLSENDHDLYAWVTGQCTSPTTYAAIVARIRAHHRIG